MAGQAPGQAGPPLRRSLLQHFNFELIRYTLLVYPQNRLKYEPIVAAQTIPVLRLHSVRELNRYYRFWGLKLP